jgi:hypothetical protein
MSATQVATLAVWIVLITGWTGFQVRLGPPAHLYCSQQPPVRALSACLCGVLLHCLLLD